jgi:hypothetical protein
MAPLRGRWVAVRDDEVVAHAAPLRKLIGDESVRASDTRFACRVATTRRCDRLSEFTLPYAIT